MKQHQFPNGFLWGTATSSFQVEGNNNNSDWWEWENNKDYKSGESKLSGKPQPWPLEPSGIACDSYNRYEEDFDLAKNMNNNAIRFSVEWARIEPEDGGFDQNEIDHYKKVLFAAKQRGLKTFVTLHHFTNPKWFAKKGGWVNFRSPEYFARYAKKCSESFRDFVDVYSTINEPQVYAFQAYMKKEWYPAEFNPLKALIVQYNFIRAHRKSYDAIKSVSPKTPVGIVKHIVWYETLSPLYAIWDYAFTKTLFWLNCDAFLLCLGKRQDYIGVNHYFTSRFSNLRPNNANDIVSDMGWWVYPPGLKNILLHLKKYKLPIYVTENGCADSKDRIRVDFLRGMLTSCAEAISEGVDLKGYFYWSLIDNYEWHQGFWPRFGLVEVDRENGLRRIPRGSSKYYSEVARNNAV